MSVDTPYTRGSIVHLVADLTGLLNEPEDASEITWLVRDPAGHEDDRSGDVEHGDPDSGEYTLDVEADAVGVWYWKVVTTGVTAVAEGSFTVSDNYDIVGDPTKPTDLRVLVPRARRYCEGPFPDANRRMTDEQLYAMVADACADVILLSGNLFGRTLIVTKREARVGYPIAWATDRVLDEWESALITAQAALNFVFHEFKDKKVSENMANEGQTWEWALSANLLQTQFNLIKDTRDKALEALLGWYPTLARFASVTAVRDRVTSSMIEWWAQANPGQVGQIGGLGGGQEAAVVPVFFPGP